VRGATDRPGEAGAVLSFRDESAQSSERMHERMGNPNGTIVIKTSRCGHDATSRDRVAVIEW